MQAFGYQYGDRPLEGYTIQRAVGRGGFGEVYCALSDSGRQVALKAINSYEQIELRGVSQCMNLKSPHLVTIFDVRHNAQGRPFVIMEYVSGPSLRQLLDESPAGLGPAKAAYFLCEIAKGLTLLHECGIVHRDLKPENIFYEDGYVKIGDYGLSKSITASQHSGQTITVGTVHYMAPEIGAGHYDRSIDIYAMGILLYEMLTGKVPFAGQSPGEILMKHLTAQPQLDAVEEPFATVIRRALDKDPAHRYRSVQEMAEALFGSEHIRQSVSQFSPTSLSTVAQRAARQAAATATPTPLPPVLRPSLQTPPPIPPVGAVRAAAMDAEATAMLARPLTMRRCVLLALVSSAAIAFGATMLDPAIGNWTCLISAMALMMGAAGGALAARRSLEWPGPSSNRPLNLPVAIFVCCGAIPAFFAALVLVPDLEWQLHHERSVYVFAVATAMILRNWRGLIGPDRKCALSIAGVIHSALYALPLSLAFHSPVVLTIGVTVGAVLAAQVMCPLSGAVLSSRASGGRAAGARPYAVPPAMPVGLRLLPIPVRFALRVAFALLLTGGVMAFMLAGTATPQTLYQHKIEVSALSSIGIGAILLSIFCLSLSTCAWVRSWWGGVIKPLIMVLSLSVLISALIFMGNCHLKGDAEIIAMLAAALGGGTFLAVLVLPRSWVQGSSPGRPAAVKPAVPLVGGVSHLSRLVALILAAVGHLGFAGLHRFYVGKIGTGILWLLTGGLLGIGQLIDLIMIICGRFRDSSGRVVLLWHGGPVATVAPMAVPPAPVGAGAAVEAPQPATGSAGQQSSVAVAAAATQPASRAAGMDTSPLRMSHPSMIGRAGDVGRAFLALLGSLCIVLGFLMGLVWAGHLREALAMGLNDTAEDWPLLADRAALVGCFGLMLLGAICLMLARRHDGLGHMARAPLGATILLVCLNVLSGAMAHVAWGDVVRPCCDRRFGQAADAFFQALSPVSGSLALCGGLLLVSVVVLARGPRRSLAVDDGRGG